MNENAKCRIIGLTIETRPDTIDADFVRQLRTYGCTRVQLGVQHTDDDILRRVNRRCTTMQTKTAIRTLKDACYKIDVHLMPNLPGSSPSKDDAMFDTMLYDDDLQVDQWKIYPCEVVPWTVIKKWYDNGSYVPYEATLLTQVVMRVKSRIHPWIRINRTVRDIPSQYILNDTTPKNLRDDALVQLKRAGTPCQCIRCREVGERKVDLTNVKMMKRIYNSSGGKEFFLSLEQDNVLLGFLRLRLSTTYTLEELAGCAMIRELHVYGSMIPVYENAHHAQNMGFGKRLLQCAERIARMNNYRKIAVISGVGVRDYYKKRGFSNMTKHEYLIKDLFWTKRRMLECLFSCIFLVVIVVLL